MCPKCKQYHTYDVIPELPNEPALQLSKDVVENTHEMTIGNGKYYCLNCDYSWKKYRGKKIYEQIKVIHANTGGYAGPFFGVIIDIESLEIDRNDYSAINIETIDTPMEEKIEWFKSELHKCDFVNWAEEYFALVMDGTQWRIQIEYESYCEIKVGSNHFPPKWTKFCRAISKISGGEFY
ncbi:hypothetical protein [Aquibacillus rhizosphaerae]|uniref:Uncharacterized protein n=1 Tax=Aquibacillus rhizosphaerae TaxID=3051431 RepID=A0ABT7L6S2_9BACI|nr:hypothetical protein [Aquibacillus sp. LR5S19]MDL4840905.1 hypothetical protein [Aquibacillus sp. LR5S19]